MTIGYRTVLALLVVCVFDSCATYTMMPEQLYSQVNNSERTKIGISSYNRIIGYYISNGIKQVECTDRHGLAVSFPNSPKVEMRITDVNGKRHNFYFDTFILDDSTFTGLNSRILGTTRSIKFSDIKKIEIQKGAKYYRYMPVKKSHTTESIYD